MNDDDISPVEFEGPPRELTGEEIAALNEVEAPWSEIGANEHALREKCAKFLAAADGDINPFNVLHVLSAMGVADADIANCAEAVKHQQETLLGQRRNLEREIREAGEQFKALYVALEALHQAAPRAGVKPAVAGLLTEAGADHRFGRFH